MLTNELRLKAIEAIKGIRSQCDLLLFALNAPDGPGLQAEDIETKLHELGRQMYNIKDFVLGALGGSKRG